MAKKYITPTMVELRAAITEAEALSAKAETTKRDEQRIGVLLAKIAALRSNAVAPDDFVERWFRAFIRGEEIPMEKRGTDLLAGTQTPSYTQGTKGGTLVPIEFHREIILGMAQFDPLLDEEVVTLVRSDAYDLRPYTVPGWDLSTFAAVKRAEGAQQNPFTVPTAAAAQLNGFIYTATLDATFEFEQDEFMNTLDQIEQAYEIGFARGIGVDLITGNGTTAPQGLDNGATDSTITTGAAGVITATDIENIYFKVDRIYRNSPKCAWVISDAIYQQIRKAVDDDHRPLINVVGDRELLMGKPIRISPSVPSTAGSKGIIFGDLSHYVVRVSRMALTRNLQAPGYVEKGKGLYTGHMRADAKVVDPTGGTVPPIVFATLHA